MNLTDSGDDGKWLRSLLDSVRKRKGMHGGIGFTLDEASLMLAISLGKTASWEARLRDQMGAAVQSGALKLRDAETGLVLPDHLQVADDWGRVTPADVNKWLQDQGVEYRWDEPEQGEKLAVQSVAPMESEQQAADHLGTSTSREQSTPPNEIDFSVLATRDRLISAFGSFTGMDATWFNNLNDSPALKSARKIRGTAGRSHTTEPWFCPYEVMLWLLSPKRKKGKPLQEATGWRMLKAHFPKTYEVHAAASPLDG